MRRMRLLFLLAALFAALTAGISAVRDAAPYTPAVPTAPATVTAPAPTQQLVVTALHATPRPIATATAQPAVKVAAVETSIQVMTTDGLNIRDCPSTKCHIVGSYVKGKVLNVKMGEGWAQVAEGRYVSTAYLRTVE